MDPGKTKMSALIQSSGTILHFGEWFEPLLSSLYPSGGRPARQQRPRRVTALLGGGLSVPQDIPEVSLVQFSRSVMSDSLRPHESQHARPPCPLRGPQGSGPDPKLSAPCRNPWTQPSFNPVWWPRVPRKFVPAAYISPSAHCTSSSSSMAALPSLGIL